MKCEVCGKARATICLEAVRGQEQVHQSLCRGCARKSQEAKLGEGFELRLTDSLPGSDGYNPGEGKRLCARCDATSKELLESGKAGCPSCYALFSQEIEHLLTKQQGNARHFGKRYRGPRGGRIA